MGKEMIVKTFEEIKWAFLCMIEGMEKKFLMCGKQQNDLLVQPWESSLEV